MARGSQGWDLREEFNNTLYEPQYPDDNVDGGVALDHCRLYVTNIAKGLNEEGLRHLFSKHGAVERIHLNRDPLKRYAIITFESSGHANVAMMKLNKIEPYKLNIRIAHKKNNQDHRDRDRKSLRLSRNGDSRSINGDFDSGSRSNYRNSEQHIMEIYDDELEYDDMVEDDIDCDLQLLKLQEAEIKIKKKMLLLNTARKMTQKTNASRCLLADGRTVVRNVSEKAAEPSDGFGSPAVESRCTCSCQDNKYESTSEDTSTTSTYTFCREEQSLARHEIKKSNKGSSTRHKLNSPKLAPNRTVLEETTIDIVSENNILDKDIKINKNSSQDECCNLRTIVSEVLEMTDKTDKLIKLRNNDYSNVDDDLKVVIALSDYPEEKIQLRDMGLFNQCVKDIIDMQLKAQLLKKPPTFLDCYINRGAIVCICNDIDTKHWIVRVSIGLKERMSCDLKLLKSKTARLCLAKMKIPKKSWPESALDAFKLMQYFNPKLNTHLWKVYAEKIIDNVQYTSFVMDNESSEIVRSFNFKNIIDYKQMNFEISEYVEIYNEDLSILEEDLGSIVSRVKLLNEIRSDESAATVRESNINFLNNDINNDVKVNIENDDLVLDDDNLHYEERDIENNPDIGRVEVKTLYCRDGDSEKEHLYVTHSCEKETQVSDQEDFTVESSLNPSNASSTLNIDTHRGIAYYRRTNYIHIDNDLKIAIVLQGYPKDKLEGTQVQLIKRSMKEIIQRNTKQQYLNEMTIPKFQDVYLSNGALVHICVNIETKNYLKEILSKLSKSMGLQLAIREINDLIRYTRIIIKLPREIAHMESYDILLKLQILYPGLKPDCWKCYSDVVGRLKRQFGVDPESLEIIKSPDFDPIYDGHRLNFRVIERNKLHSENEKATDKKNSGDSDITERERILAAIYCKLNTGVTPMTFKMKENHFADYIPDDFKIYISPTNYPEMHVNDILFNDIKMQFENLVIEMYASDHYIPRLYDMYLYEGAVFAICKDITSRTWIENNIETLNTRLNLKLKTSELRGAVGIVNLTLETNRTYEEVINILQQKNPRIRTKFWRLRSINRSKNELDAVLQIDLLSAQVISSPYFNGAIDNYNVKFELGHLQNVLKSRISLDEFCIDCTDNLENKSTGKRLHNLNCREYRHLFKEDAEISDKSKHAYVDEILITDKNIRSENDHTKRLTEEADVIDRCEVDLQISPILPNSSNSLSVIFNLLNNNNPKLNTHLWEILSCAKEQKGHFKLSIDIESASVIKGKNFNAMLGGEELVFKF